MARKQRPDPTDGWHHVMNRGVDRQLIFFDDIDRIEFGRCLAFACRRFSVEVHAYCLMDNHFHLLLRCPSGGVSDVMHLTCGLYARYVNKRTGRVGHLFGDRFTSRLVTSYDYIAIAVRYIHRNSLDIAGVQRCGDYRWSSHQLYLGRRSAPDFIRTEYVMQWFDDVTAFDRFVDGSSSPLTLTDSPIPEDEAETILTTIDLVIAERSTLTGRSVLGQRRSVALGLAEGSRQDVHDEIVDALELQSPNVLASARFRARRHLEGSSESRQILASTSELVCRPIVRLASAS